MDTTKATDWKSTLSYQRSRLLNTLLLITVLGGATVLAIQYITLIQQVDLRTRLQIMLPYFVCLALVTVVWAWRSLDHSLRASVLILLGLALGAITMARGGLPGSGRIWMLLPVALAFVLVGSRAGVLTSSIALIIYLLVSIAINQKWIVPTVAADLTSSSPLLTEGISYIVGVVILGALFYSFGQNWSETLVVADTLNQRLRLQAEELEKTNERLQLQTNQLQAATEIAQTCFSILNEEQLLTEAAHHILDHLSPMGVYHVGLFLRDEEHGYADLKAATGEAGRLALELGYQVQLDDSSLIGQSIISGQPRFISNVGARGTSLGQIPMPHTRSELILPLRSRGIVLGALDIHSTRESAFSESDIAVIQTIADQVAIALDNARLFSRTEAVLAEMREVQRRYLREAWEQFLSLGAAEGRPHRADYTLQGTTVKSLPNEIKLAAIKQGQPVLATTSEQPASAGSQVIVVKADQEALILPLKLREQVIGT
ncbi:MAG: GAF domain-containing protein, partial [Anaerolineae bacterium]|nr:GAF domain-containing protein [Anaerolineae bacterium]